MIYLGEIHFYKLILLLLYPLLVISESLNDYKLTHISSSSSRSTLTVAAYITLYVDPISPLLLFFADPNAKYRGYIISLEERLVFFKSTLPMLIGDLPSLFMLLIKLFPLGLISLFLEEKFVCFGD